MEDGQSGRTSWTSLKASLCEIRNNLLALSCSVPSSVTFRQQGDFVRIYFLGSLFSSCETTLYYVDVSPNGPTGHLSWKSAVQWVCAGRVTSREEQLLIERKRLTTYGITSYQREGSDIIFPAGGTLFKVADTPNVWNGNDGAYPCEIRIPGTGAKMSPFLCPGNSQLVAFRAHGDVFVWHDGVCLGVQVSHCVTGPDPSPGAPPPPITAGLPSYVIQEEFSRYDSIWWQPKQTETGVWRLLYEEIDESNVELHSISGCRPESVRFPRAGTPNSISTLRLAEIRLGTSLTCKVRSLVNPLQVLFPWMEYLVRVGWVPDGKSIWVEVLNRSQSHLELVVLPLDVYFGPPGDPYDSSFSPPLSPTLEWPPAPVQNGHAPLPPVIASHSSDVWINVHDLLHWLPSGKELLWASEDSGFRHLVLVRLGDDLQVVSTTTLTSGDWEVCDSSLRVDPVRRIAYFMGVRETPLEKHLYCVSLDHPGQITLLTTPGFSYSIDMDADCTVVVATYSNVETPPVCQVFWISHPEGETSPGVRLMPGGFLVQPVKRPPITIPQLHSHTLDSGEVLHAMVFPPHGYVPGQSYPTVLNVYGGPEVQTVSNTFKGMRLLRCHLLAARGYCVVTVDSRGSRHRGLKFEGHIHRRMGQVELDDQIVVLHSLARRLNSMIDLTRVAIYGWSYGGYLSLMGLAKYPDVFKVCIAGAPVTCWSLYDTGYTERYMGTPDTNPDGYKCGSVLKLVSQFPDDENRLLIVHGLMDDNVHFTHTAMLINELISQGKPYSLQIYPGERHSLRSQEASKHFEAVVMFFLENHL